MLCTTLGQCTQRGVGAAHLRRGNPATSKKVNNHALHERHQQVQHTSKTRSVVHDGSWCNTNNRKRWSNTQADKQRQLGTRHREPRHVYFPHASQILTTRKQAEGRTWSISSVVKLQLVKCFCFVFYATSHTFARLVFMETAVSLCLSLSVFF